MRATLELPPQPHVVPVAESYEITPAELRRLQERVGGADVLGVDLDPHREWCPARERLDDRDRVVARPIVADDDLRRQQRLPRETFQLLAQVCGAVVRGERDRD